MKELFFRRNNLKDMPSMFVNDSNGSAAASHLQLLIDCSQPLVAHWTSCISWFAVLEPKRKIQRQSTHNPLSLNRFFNSIAPLGVTSSTFNFYAVFEDGVQLIASFAIGSPFEGDSLSWFQPFNQMPLMLAHA